MKFTIDVQTAISDGPSGLDFQRLLGEIAFHAVHMRSNTAGGSIEWDGRSEMWSLTAESEDDWTLTIYEEEEE